MRNSDTFSVVRRRALLRQAAALTSAYRAGGHPDPDRSGQNAALLRACAGFCAIEREKLALFYGRDRIVDDDARTSRLLPMDEAQRPYVDAMCQLQASGMPVHRARVMAFLLADHGELYRQARDGGSPDERLLAAIVRDIEVTA